MKKCNSCNVEKPHSEFWKDSNRSDKLNANCKECACVKQKAKREQPHIIEQRKAYDLEYNRRPHVKEKARQYHIQKQIDAGNAAAAEFARQQSAKHPIPAGKSMVTVEKGIYFTRQGRYRPKANGKWLGSFYTLDGAREALKDDAEDKDIEKLKQEIRQTKQKLEILQEALEALENEK